jgi:hypothetical protein
VAAEHLSADGVELTRGGPRRNGVHHRLTGFCDHPTCSNQSIEFLLIIDGHGETLWRVEAPYPGTVSKVELLGQELL